MIPAKSEERSKKNKHHPFSLRVPKGVRLKGSLEPTTGTILPGLLGEADDRVTYPNPHETGR